MPDPATTNLILTVLGVVLLGLFLITNGVVLSRKLRPRSQAVPDSVKSVSGFEADQQAREEQVPELNPESVLLLPSDEISVEIQQNLSALGEHVEGRIENRLELLDELVCEADREIENLSEILEEMRPGSSLHSTEQGESGDFDWRNTAPNRPAFDETHRQMIGSLYHSGYSTSDIASLTGSREAAIEAIVRPVDRDAA